VGGWTGALGAAGNIGDDPLFVDADGPDDIVGTDDDNLRLSPISACIDVGASAAVPADTANLHNDGNTTEPAPFDLDGNSVVDMGAYELYAPLVESRAPAEHQTSKFDARAQARKC
jgi:hypothetical protein